jgi:hypothetical protein
VEAEDIGKVRKHVEETIGGDPERWTGWPGGWPGDIESALIDAVFSARAIYRTEYGRGIYRSVVDWRVARTRHMYSLDTLVAEIGAVGVPVWARSCFGNTQLSPGRREDAPCGRSKAAAVLEAAGKLRNVGINVAADIDSDTVATAKQAVSSVSGIGYATANYFLMLLGVPGIKPDRMIHRFLKESTGHAFTNACAEQILREIASRLDVQAHELDHAIWRYESERAMARTLKPECASRGYREKKARITERGEPRARELPAPGEMANVQLKN